DGRFNKPSPKLEGEKAAAAWKKYDNDLFQTARLITSGSEGAERGTGNVVSAEFNLCYWWHSCISAKDEAWIEEFYYELFGQPGGEVNFHELIMGFSKFE
ncbi:hypothetical protein N0V85_009928, partial [Neurospora sp. IMI 360204]